MFQKIICISFLIVLQMGFYYHANFKTIALGKNNSEISNVEIAKSNIPVLSPQDIIFEVRHSKSPNVVVYQANRTFQKSLDPEKPIDVYWLLNNKGKKTETLTLIEWRMAFGYKLLPIIKGKKYKIMLNAIKDREITISENESGKVEAYMSINGIFSKLTGVFIDFEYSFYLPKVNYVEFLGYDLKTKKRSSERIYSEA